MSTIAAGFIGTIEVGNIGTVAAGNIGTIAETGNTRPRNATSGCSHMCQAILRARAVMAGTGPIEYHCCCMRVFCSFLFEVTMLPARGAELKNSDERK